EGCASSAWVYAVLGEHQWIIASYPLQAQIDVWGDNPLALTASSLAPRAAATRVAGGWRLSGQYSFSSGSSHAHWAIIGALLGAARGDRPRPTRAFGRYRWPPRTHLTWRDADGGKRVCAGHGGRSRRRDRRSNADHVARQADGRSVGGGRWADRPGCRPAHA